MPRSPRLAVIVILSACAAIASDLAPDLRLEDLAGQSRSLADYRGKIVVLNFWATWCEPCRDEMPLLVDAQKRYAGRDVVVLAASLDETDARDQVAKFVRKQKLNFPVWLGASTETLKQFQAGESLPATVFIDGGGRVAFRVLGPLKKRDLAKRLESLVGERKQEPGRSSSQGFLPAAGRR